MNSIKYMVMSQSKMNDLLGEYVRDNNPTKVSELLKAGAKSNEKLLVNAIIENSYSVVKLLLENNDSFIIFLGNVVPLIFEFIDLNMFKLLLEHHLDPNLRHTSGNTTLMLSILYKPQFVEVLLEYGADPNRSNYEGITPIMVCIPNNDIKSLKNLLKKGADPNLQDINGCTALMHAIEKKRWNIVKELLKAGADPFLKDDDGHNAFYGTDEFYDRETFEKIYKQMQYKMNPVVPLLLHAETPSYKKSKGPPLPKELVRNLNTYLKFSRKKSKSRLHGKRI